MSKHSDAKMENYSMERTSSINAGLALRKVRPKELDDVYHRRAFSHAELVPNLLIPPPPETS